MDERAIKRLLITLAMAIAAILMAKYLLMKAATNVGQAAERKRATATVQPASVPPADSPVEATPEEPAPSTMADAASAPAPAEPANP